MRFFQTVWEPSPLLLLISIGQKNYSCFFLRGGGIDSAAETYRHDF